MSVTVTDSTDRKETNLTDADGKAVVPPATVDITDINGYGELNGYSVTVVDENKAIENASLTLNEDNSVSVVLPAETLIVHNNRITVTVLNKTDKAPVSDMTVTVSELPKTDIEPKSVSGKTDKYGKIVVPPLSEDITDDNGNSDITEEKPGKGENTDGDGIEDKPGEIETVTYNVSVNDTKGIITNAFVTIKDGKVYVTLPETHTLTTANQTTVTVTDKDGKAVLGVLVTITDKNNISGTGTTNNSGKVTLPVKSSGGGGGSSSGGSSGGGGGGISYNSSVNIKITDKDSKAVTGFSKSVDNKGNVTITLPTGKTLDGGNYYTVTVTDNKGVAKADTFVTLKDKNKNEVSGTTDKNGVLVLPAKEHKAYIVGYDDGTFRPDSNMSRAEAAAIFARLISEKKGENVSGTKTSFSDISKNEWFAGYVSYLENYGIIKGYNDNTFRPDSSVTRAEFVAMTVRFYGLFENIKTVSDTTKYTDINAGHWAVKDISYATSEKWLNGYADGTFKPDINITRAEVVTVVNRATGRNADKEYINKNLSSLNKFTDLKNNSYWAFYDIEEACNDHRAANSSVSEVWCR